MTRARRNGGRFDLGAVVALGGAILAACGDTLSGSDADSVGGAAYQTPPSSGGTTGGTSGGAVAQGGEPSSGGTTGGTSGGAVAQGGEPSGGGTTGGTSGGAVAQGGEPSGGGTTGGVSGGAVAQGGEPSSGGTMGGVAGGAVAQGGEPSGGGTTGGVAGGGAGGVASDPHIWTADSVRIELSCGKIGSAGGAPCSGSWAADAALLTPEQLAIIEQMTVLTPVYPQATCDGGGWVIRVTNRSGTVRQYWAGQFVSNCQEASWYGPEISGRLAEALFATFTWCWDTLALNSAHATAILVDQCIAGYANPSSSAGSSLWARFTLPQDESYLATAMDGNKGGVANPYVALRLYDSLLLYDTAATTVLAESAPGASLTVAEPGDYVLEVRSVGAVGSQVALELDRAGGGGGAGGSGPGTGGNGGSSTVVTPSIWTADSARIELVCGALGSATPSCQGSWAADAARLTAEQLDLISRMTVLPVQPRLSYYTCYRPGYAVTVTDRSGTSRLYWGGDVDYCRNAPYPELPAELVQALAATITWCDAALALDSNQATAVEAGQCLTGYASSGSSLWARFTLPAGASYTVTAMDGNEGGSVNANVALRLHDSTGTTVLTETQPGAPLTVAEPGDYLLEVRNVAGVGCQVALRLALTG